MKKRSNVLILACIPAVFVLILLGTGLPQRFLPAVTVGQQTYTVAQYNFYYYEAYASFVTEHYDELDTLGLDLTRELKNQPYDETMSWARYFRAGALSDMREYTILYDAAVSEGFDAADRIAEVRTEKAEELKSYCVANNIKNVDTYLVGLYDAGMTEEIFYRELDRRTTAEAYRDALLEQMTPEIAAPAASSEGDYLTADAVVSLFRPAADRVTGQSEARQWDNAEALAHAAQERAEAWGGDFAAYTAAAAAYSELGDENVPDGHYTALTREDLEGALEDWCLDPERKFGDTAVLRGEAGWYLVYFSGWGESAQALRTRQAQRDQAYDDWLAARAEDYPVRTSAIGMQIGR
jgi:hypothetical protein